MRREKRESLGSRRKNGWGMDLYRNRSEGWIGVCALVWLTTGELRPGWYGLLRLRC